MDGAAPHHSDKAQMRIMRAGALMIALRDAHPDDADQIICAWLHGAGDVAPRTGFLDVELSAIVADAEMWAEAAPRVEIAAYVRSGMQKLAASALAAPMRRNLIALLWRGLSPDDKRAFIERVTR